MRPRQGGRAGGAPAPGPAAPARTGCAGWRPRRVFAGRCPAAPLAPAAPPPPRLLRLPGRGHARRGAAVAGQRRPHAGGGCNGPHLLWGGLSPGTRQPDGWRKVSEARIRGVYAARHDPAVDSLGAGDRFIHEQRDAALASLLQDEGLAPLDSKRILEVGCGDGRVLGTLRQLGALEDGMAGIDLLDERVATASRCLPGADLRVGAAFALPWPDAYFDMVVQFTMVSSLLEAAERRATCNEMARVLAPGGAILWYDFIWNPLNRETHGVTLGELRTLFPRARVEAQRLTLLPPLARVVAPLSSRVCRLLEQVPLLRTHYLAVVRPS
ncbi:MAG: methyltransferase domain-containing protein [Dehalococcoidia bacterium]|nr:methyltransferase domain-containing protein [Dehalococcoidia bacterium]